MVNQVDGESSVFNTLRSKRPVSKPPQDPLEYIEQTAASTKDSCDFCKFREHTAEDVFGRYVCFSLNPKPMFDNGHFKFD